MLDFAPVYNYINKNENCAITPPCLLYNAAGHYE